DGAIDNPEIAAVKLRAVEIQLLGDAYQIRIANIADREIPTAIEVTPAPLTTLDNVARGRRLINVTRAVRLAGDGLHRASRQHVDERQRGMLIERALIEAVEEIDLRHPVFEVVESPAALISLTALARQNDADIDPARLKPGRRIIDIVFFQGERPR